MKLTLCSLISVTSNVNINNFPSKISFYSSLSLYICIHLYRTSNGNVLVITCEGNCGFYESGIISTPLNKGYSILGWNHPGFGSSTVSIIFISNRS